MPKPNHDQLPLVPTLDTDEISHRMADVLDRIKKLSGVRDAYVDDWDSAIANIVVTLQVSRWSLHPPVKPREFVRKWHVTSLIRAVGIPCRVVGQPEPIRERRMDGRRPIVGYTHGFYKIEVDILNEKE